MKVWRPTLVALFISLVWLINGFYCKILNAVPRHTEIVGRIVEVDSPRFLTILIGLGECLMAIWVFSRMFVRQAAIVQILLIATMNIIEAIMVPDLLLWGYWNGFFAFLFILLITADAFGIRSAGGN